MTARDESGPRHIVVLDLTNGDTVVTDAALPPEAGNTPMAIDPTGAWAFVRTGPSALTAVKLDNARSCSCPTNSHGSKLSLSPSPACAPALAVAARDEALGQPYDHDMTRTKIAFMVAGAFVALGMGAGAAVALAGDKDDTPDTPITGSNLERASSAASPPWAGAASSIRRSMTTAITTRSR